LLPILVVMMFAFLGWKLGYNHSQKTSIFANFIEKSGWFEMYTQNRIKPMISAYNFVSKNLLHFVFGVGPGNASDSFAKSMTGKYSKEYDLSIITSTQITKFTWEIGFGGILIIYIFLWMLFYDTKKYSLLSNYYGVISLSLISVSALFGASFFYNNIFSSNVILYPSFFLFGFIASGKYYSHEWQ
jgi:hypothetical protein